MEHAMTCILGEYYAKRLLYRSQSKLLKRAILTKDCNRVAQILNVYKSLIDFDMYKEGGHTPLTCACLVADYYTVHTIINAGANVNAPNIDSGLYPIHYAAERDNRDGHSRDILILLLEHNASVDAVSDCRYRNPSGALIYSQKTPLMHAIEFRNLEAVTLLLRFRANANFISQMSLHSPLLLAAGVGDYEMMKQLLLKNADASHLSQYNHSALSWLCNQLPVSEDNEAYVDLLTAHGCPVDTSSTRTGRTPLMAAIKRGLFNISRRLIALGADTNAYDKRGLSVEDYARSNGDKRCLVLVISARSAPSLHRIVRHDQSEQDISTENDDRLNQPLRQMIDRRRRMRYLK